MGFKKGHTPWLKGTTGVAKPNSGSFQKGNTPPSHKKGCKCFRCTDEGRRTFPKGHTPWNKGKVGVTKGVFKMGKYHPNWQGGKPKSRGKYVLSYEDYRKYRTWRKEVFKRDGWNCQDCGHHGGVLHAHHIKQWAVYPKLRYKLTNGLTLCPTCHKKTDSYSRRSSDGALVDSGN